MKKQRSIVTQTVMRVSGVFITAIILLTIVFTIFIGRYMRDNILRSKEEQLVTVADTLDSRLNSLCYAGGLHTCGQTAAGPL